MFAVNFAWYIPFLLLCVGIFVILIVVVRNIREVMHAVNGQPANSPVLIEQVKTIGEEQKRVADALVRQQGIIKEEMSTQHELLRSELESLNPGDALKENQEIIIYEQKRVAAEKAEQDTQLETN